MSLDLISDMLELMQKLREQLHLSNRSIHLTVNNNSSYVLILDSVEFPLNLVHGVRGRAKSDAPWVSPEIILPGDTGVSLLGGQSVGAGVELDGRLGVWDIPELNNYPVNDRTNRLLWLRSHLVQTMEHPDDNVSRRWEFKTNGRQKSSLYFMLDNPLLGTNKMNAIDVVGNSIRFSPHSFVERSKITGDYNYEDTGNHDLNAKTALKGQFGIGKGDDCEAVLDLFSM